jgi:DNA-directed RNA polymerase sigma subunit (sigma70/sigma32)
MKTLKEELELRRDLSNEAYLATKRIAKILLHERMTKNLNALEYSIAKDRLVNQMLLEDVGKKHGVTRYRIKQIEDKYMARLWKT